MYRAGIVREHLADGERVGPNLGDARLVFEVKHEIWMSFIYGHSGSSRIADNPAIAQPAVCRIERARQRENVSRGEPKESRSVGRIHEQFHDGGSCSRHRRS